MYSKRLEQSFVIELLLLIGISFFSNEILANCLVLALEFYALMNKKSMILRFCLFIKLIAIVAQIVITGILLNPRILLDSLLSETTEKWVTDILYIQVAVCCVSGLFIAFHMYQIHLMRGVLGEKKNSSRIKTH